MARAPQAPPNSTDESQAQIAHLEQRIGALEALQEVALVFSSEFQLERLLALILSSAVDVMKASAGSLLLYDGTTKELVFQVVQGGGGKALRQKRIRSDEGIAGWVFSRGQPVIVHDTGMDSRHLLRIDEALRFHTAAMVAAPLIYKGKPIGVIEIINKKSGEQFVEDDQDLLMAFAAQAAVVIENARLFQQVVSERDRLLVVEEEVRRELARELHDGPSQILAAIIMGLKFLKQVIARQPERTETELAELERLAAQALHQVRNMLFDLRPVALETQGLRAALEIYVERLRASEDVKLHLDVQLLKTRWSPKVEAALFSIIQEAVGNAKKHAQPKNIWITAQPQDDQIALSVRDDGRGFDLAHVEESYAQRGNLGLLNMKERAEIANATLDINSKPGKGTLVTLTVPMRQPTRRSARVFSSNQ
ncbi:MAG: GAF domain-containing sensor histidine kinase [Chloroflexi bacterium]|nr:GAF domain-containing sensor histidine kinase [Chloroflexota bacterium]